MNVSINMCAYAHLLDINTFIFYQYVDIIVYMKVQNIFHLPPNDLAIVFIFKFRSYM